MLDRIELNYSIKLSFKSCVVGRVMLNNIIDLNTLGSTGLDITVEILAVVACFEYLIHSEPDFLFVEGLCHPV